MPPLGRLLAPAAALLLTEGAWAQGPSLFTGGGLQATRGSLLGEGPPDAAPAPLVRARAEVPDTAEAEEARARAQSLFIGRASGGLFAPLAPRDRGHSGGLPDALEALRGDDPEARMIRDLIARAEAGPKGYDAVQYGARRKPDRPPTEMTLGDVFAWIEATPGQPHAIGRYQFIPPTLARLADLLGAGPHERFSPDLQDRLADVLLHEAGLARYRSGAITRHEFMNNLARIWAGLPNSSGRSHYHGYAGNAATMTWSEFDGEMARIFRS
jgi:hypothetical protein